MAALDEERLVLAEQIRQALAIENALTRPQARAYVRCLQTTWQVPTIGWGDRESASQLNDARRLLHAAHIFSTIEGRESPERSIATGEREKFSNGSRGPRMACAASYPSNFSPLRRTN